jgi:hypothetical protein
VWRNKNEKKVSIGQALPEIAGLAAGDMYNKIAKKLDVKVKGDELKDGDAAHLRKISLAINTGKGSKDLDELGEDADPFDFVWGPTMQQQQSSKKPTKDDSEAEDGASPAKSPAKPGRGGGGAGRRGSGTFAKGLGIGLSHVFAFTWWYVASVFPLPWRLGEKNAVGIRCPDFSPSEVLVCYLGTASLSMLLHRRLRARMQTASRHEHRCSASSV